MMANKCNSVGYHCSSAVDKEIEQLTAKVFYHADSRHLPRAEAVMDNRTVGVMNRELDETTGAWMMLPSGLLDYRCNFDYLLKVLRITT
jgi:hypothetical protein